MVAHVLVEGFGDKDCIPPEIPEIMWPMLLVPCDGKDDVLLGFVFLLLCF